VLLYCFWFAVRIVRRALVEYLPCESTPMCILLGVTFGFYVDTNHQL
jgi:hypothetical protein